VKTAHHLAPAQKHSTTKSCCKKILHTQLTEKKPVIFRAGVSFPKQRGVRKGHWKSRGVAERPLVKNFRCEKILYFLTVNNSHLLSFTRQYYTWSLKEKTRRFTCILYDVRLPPHSPVPASPR